MRVHWGMDILGMIAAAFLEFVTIIGEPIHRAVRAWRERWD